jgi:hypothetical protein
MIANSAFLAVLILLLAVFWIAGETTFLTPYKRSLFTEYGIHIGTFVLVVFVNLFAGCYAIGRLLFLRDTGHKLHHLDRQLSTRDTVLADLTDRLEER